MNTLIDYPIAQPASTGVSFLIDASGEKVAGIGRVTKTGNVDRVVFRTGAVTTPQTLRASLQDVDLATGDPDGTADQSGTQASPAASTTYTVTLSASRAVTKGDLLAAVIEFDSTAGNLNIQGVGANASNFGYLDHYTTSWAKQTSRSPMFALGYDDGTYAPVLGWSPPNVTNLTFNNTSSPDERALYFVCPEQIVVAGMTAIGQWSGDVDFVIYDSGSNVVASASRDKDASLGQTSYGRVFFTTPVTLQAGQVYRACVKPTSGTNVTLNYLLVPTQAVLGATYWGTDAYLSSRTDAGAWSQDTTQQPCITLIVDRSTVPNAYSRGRVVNR